MLGNFSPCPYPQTAPTGGCDDLCPMACPYHPMRRRQQAVAAIAISNRCYAEGDAAESVFLPEGPIPPWERGRRDAYLAPAWTGRDRCYRGAVPRRGRSARRTS
jgi:hypothetical protein